MEINFQKSIFFFTLLICLISGSFMGTQDTLKCAGIKKKKNTIAISLSIDFLKEQTLSRNSLSVACIYIAT